MKLKLDWRPPKHISEESKTTWSSCVPRLYRSPGKLQVLTTVLECRENIFRLAEQLKTEDLSVMAEGATMPHANPLLRSLKEERQQYLRAVSQLNIRSTDEVDLIPLEIVLQKCEVIDFCGMETETVFDEFDQFPLALQKIESASE